MVLGPYEVKTQGKWRIATVSFKQNILLKCIISSEKDLLKYEVSGLKPVSLCGSQDDDRVFY